MAYIFYSPAKKGLLAITSNDTDKTAITSHFLNGSYVEENLSDTDFLKLRQNTHGFNFQNENPVLEEIAIGFPNKEVLDQYINLNLIPAIDLYLSNWKNHAHYSKWTSYKTQLENLDTTSITYPLNKSLEKHFADEGQPYYSLLELP